MSALSDKRMFERSSLPADAQLGLHVNAREFLDLVRREQEAKIQAAQGAAKLLEFLRLVRGEAEHAKPADKPIGGATEAARSGRAAGIRGQQTDSARQS